MSIQTINPATGESMKAYEAFSKEQINATLEQAHKAFKQWKTRSFAERAAYMHNVATQLRKQKSSLARLAVLEMGKSITEAEAEIEKCASCCDYFADNAEHFLAKETLPSNASESYVAFRPLGVVLAIMPWNFPYWQVPHPH